MRDEYYKEITINGESDLPEKDGNYIFRFKKGRLSNLYFNRDEWVYYMRCGKKGNSHLSCWQVISYLKPVTVPEQEGWISVKDKLPELTEAFWGYNDENEREKFWDNDHAIVLAFDPEIGIFKAKLDKRGSWSEIGKSYINSTVKPTHWQPLPSIPTNI